MEFNPEQLEAINSNEDAILCLAAAGSGKTATLTARVARLVNDGVDPTSILALTFTNAAALEMRERYSRLAGVSTSSNAMPEFRTFHSFCYNLIIHDKNIREKLGYEKIPQVCDDAEYTKIRKEVVLALSLKLTEDEIKAGHSYNKEKQRQIELFNKGLRKELRSRNLITFDMMCYNVGELFVANDETTVYYKNKYKYIACDEFQDTDPRQFKFVSSFSNNTKFFCVGDCLQCQPTGTQVMVQYGHYKNIEDLVVGDTVVSYSPSNGYFRSKSRLRHVSAIEHHFANDIVTIETTNHSSSYTLEHITYVKIHFEGNENKRVIYLMHNSNKGWWRIGECALFLEKNNSGFGLRHRMQEEKATEGWILAITDKGKNDSFYLEQVTAAKYGIPDITWQTSNVEWVSDGLLDKFYSEIPDIDERAQKCLAAFGKMVEYPFFRSDQLFKHFSKLHMFECNVCNVFPVFMDIVVPCPNEQSWNAQNGYTPSWHNTYEQVISIKQEEPCEVYSLDIEEDHNYIADGILTHNCIYQFRGTTNEYIKTLAKAPNWKLVKLYRNYRSTKQICDFANKFSKYAKDEYRIPMKSDREGEEVEIITGACASYDSPVDQRHLNLLIKKIQENPRETAVLCRTNKEVRAVCDYLKSANIEYNRSTKETDILSILHSALDNEYFKEYLTTLLDGSQYADYIRLSYNNKDADLRWFLSKYNHIDKIKKQVNKVVKIRQIVTDASTSTQGKLHDIKKVLKIKESKEFDIEEGVSGRQLVEALRDIVLEQEETSVYVGTIHSVKGLEYDTVYVMGVDDKLFQLGDEEMNNLFYVAITRPMNHLTIFRR